MGCVEFGMESNSVMTAESKTEGDEGESENASGSKGKTVESEEATVSKEARIKNAKALSIIQGALTDELFPRIRNEKTAQGAWNVLKREYRGDKKVRAVKLQAVRGEFEYMRMGENESLDHYLTKFFDTVNNLKALGEELPENRIVQKLLMSLSRRYRSIVSIIEETRDLDVLRAEEVIAFVNVFDRREDLHDERESSTELKRHSAALRLSKGKFNPSGRDKFKVTQSGTKGEICNLFGHNTNDCNDYKQLANCAKEEEEVFIANLFYACHAASIKNKDETNEDHAKQQIEVMHDGVVEEQTFEGTSNLRTELNKEVAASSFEKDFQEMQEMLQQLKLEKEKTEVLLKEKDEMLKAKDGEIEMKGKEQEKMKTELKKLQKLKEFKPTMTLPFIQVLNEKEQDKKRKKGGNEIKRPCPPYSLWYKDQWNEVKKENPDAEFKDISHILGAKWKTITAEEKKPYEEKYQVEKEAYLKLMTKDKRETEAMKLFDEESQQSQWLEIQIEVETW
uniref:HMG box domain-containing protein n=1 Tax=Salix viminalis TaxID=40686 RepID=A0A6N2KP11_SALVM